MATYTINKGVGRSVEFKGLRAQYVIYAAAGIIMAFFAFFACSFMFSQWVAVAVTILIVGISLGAAFWANRKFGEFGLTQFYAQNACTKRIANRSRVYKIVKTDEN